jgi:predicted nucleotidyltransferase component of viral defense system
MFLHELPDVKELFLVVSDEKAIHPSIVEKDYWVMHTLWGLQQQGFEFELKGGTSLSKGFKIIDRFSEDIDIQIHPDSSLEVKAGKNHNKKAILKQEKFF